MSFSTIRLEAVHPMRTEFQPLVADTHVFPHSRLLRKFNVHGMSASMNLAVTILIKFLIIILGTNPQVWTKAGWWIFEFMDHEGRHLGYVLVHGCYRTFRTAEQEFSDKVQMRS